MASLRLRYEDGRLIPLDPLPGLKNGDEIEVEWPSTPSPDDIAAMLDHTRGLWADWENIEQLVNDSREKWDKAWQDRLSSS